MAVVDKIMSIYYGEDKLPYKDIDRKVHYPIGNGDIFVGENNTTKIRFYVDKIGGSAFTWLATVKLPDGSLVYQLTSEVSDTGYVEVDISGFYTEIVGNIFVALTGFVAEDVNIVEEDGTYEVSGNPARLVTGSVKIVINYAPLILNLGADITSQQYEQLLGLIATKMAKIQGIPYYADITNISASEIQKAELKDNQIVFDTTSSSFYEYSTETQAFTKVELDIEELADKVDKIWQPNIVYGTNGYPEQVGIAYTSEDTANTIMKRDANGRAQVSSPSADKDIANKGFVEGKIQNEVNRADNKYETKVDHEEELQEIRRQIEAIIGKSDVVDIVGTYAELLQYDKSKLSDKDIIEVLDDEEHDNRTSFYRFNKSASYFSFIGSLDRGLTESEARAIFLTKTEASSTYQRKVIYSNIQPSNLQPGDIWVSNGLYDDDTDYTLDYADLTNKPKINNVVLSGNKTLAQLGINNNRVIIKQGGTQKGTFTLNQDSDTTIDLDEGGTSFELGSYDSTKSYALYEIFLYDGTVGMTTVAHSAEAYNPSHNKLFASKYVVQEGQTITHIDLHDAVIELDDRIDIEVETLESSIADVDDKLNANVIVKQTGNTFTYSGDTVTYNKKYKNLNTGDVDTDTEVLALANSTTAGLMSPTTVNAIQQMRNEIDALEGQTVRLLYTAKSNPTANEIKAFVVVSGYTDESYYAGISVVVQETNHIWKWISNTEVFNDFGLDSVSQFTNSLAGIIKGSENDGKIYAEDDGTGSVYGWSALKSTVNAKANDSDLPVANPTGASSGTLNKLKVGNTIYSLANVYSDGNNIFTGTNTFSPTGTTSGSYGTTRFNGNVEVSDTVLFEKPTNTSSYAGSTFTTLSGGSGIDAMYVLDVSNRLQSTDGKNILDITQVTAKDFVYVGSDAEGTFNNTVVQLSGNTYLNPDTEESSLIPSSMEPYKIAVKGDLPVANPSGTASTTLNKLQIGNTIYSLPSGGGGEGTSDYTELTNKPQINNVELSGNKSASDLGLLLASKVSVQTTAPTSAISDGGIHIVVLSAEPTTKYDGYIYFIEEQ